MKREAVFIALDMASQPTNYFSEEPALWVLGFSSTSTRLGQIPDRLGVSPEN
jgi:hypothetical protein